MIIIKYRGGLGNQMFQYAFQLAMQKRYPETEILADLSHYQLLTEHNGFELETAFGLTVSQPENAELKKISPYYVPSKGYQYLPEKFRQIIACNLQYKYYDVQKRKKAEVYYKQEYHNTYESRVYDLPLEQDWYLDGLWQDIRYFKECENEVRSAFQFKNAGRFVACDLESLHEISDKNSVGIHVRRGDFVNSKFDICSMDYYREAVKKVYEQIDEPKFFLFTDDVEYVEKEFAWLEYKRIIKHNVDDSILDMEMLSKCNHKIISNSTFAFWSAWLGEQKDNLIIAPQYSIIKADKKFELRTPENWVQI